VELRAKSIKGAVEESYTQIIYSALRSLFISVATGRYQVLKDAPNRRKTVAVENLVQTPRFLQNTAL